ncbi:MAG: hypothetical protein ACI9UK_001499 [Candidatus Krumholzibacteriia bacterium]|jgi:hypothetical protein
MMRSTRKYVWIVTLCIFTSGCAGAYQPARLPDAIQEDDSNGEQLDVVRIGDYVRVTLVSGQKLDGMFVKVDDDMLTLQYELDGDLIKRNIEVAEVAKIEIKQNTGGEVSTPVVAIIVAVVIGLIIGGVAMSQVEVPFDN